MRLINTTTLQFCEFFDGDLPRYAILSHRWGSDEASFQDFEKGVQQSREGFAKIKQCCDHASQHGFEWAWIDTCCIDKKSSAELTEAINSMYNWYRRAKVCYVHLTDVLWENGTSELHQASMKRFRESLWFTRGWTLQELLAPPIHHFVDQNWRDIGTKDDLAQEISEITGIDTQHLLPNVNKNPVSCTKATDCRYHPDPFRYRFTGKWEPSVATRMSWASKRQTSRIEDMAYCLLGIFDVNMPPLYGEGRKAFMRLQYEIIKQTNDDSIFAWTSDQESTGVLAHWPSNFASSRYVHSQGPIQMRRRPYAITNQGLNLPITWRASYSRKYGQVPILRVLLNCGMCGPQGSKNIVLSLISPSGRVWVRVNGYKIDTMEDGTWYDPIDAPKSDPMQDSGTSNKVKAKSQKKLEGVWTLPEPLDGLREIMIRAEWFHNTNSPSQIYDPLSDKT